MFKYKLSRTIKTAIYGTTIGFKNIEPSFWRLITLTPRDLYSWFIYQKIGNLFAIELSNAHNFHLHDENSANKKRDKTSHFFECSRKELFHKFILTFLFIQKLPKNYHWCVCHSSFMWQFQKRVVLICICEKNCKSKDDLFT